MSRGNPHERERFVEPRTGLTPEQVRQLAENTRLTKETHLAVVGDKNLGHRGIVGRLEDHDAEHASHTARILTLENKLLLYNGVMAGLIFAWEIFKAVHTFKPTT